MAWSYRIDPARRVVFSVFEGTVTDEELPAYAAALRADPDFEPSFSQLADTRGVVRLDVSGAAVGLLVGVNPYGAGSRTAVVVSSDLAFGMARMYQIRRSSAPDEVEVFRDVNEARRWLGLDEEP
jgi:hypothetical protein